MYFWIIQSVPKFLDNLNECIKVQDRIEGILAETSGELEDHDEVMKEAESPSLSRLHGPHSKHRSPKCFKDRKRSVLRCKKIKDLIPVFSHQQERARELRDALFSVSGVVETRLSIRLAENVRLLTFVSIFYLPLGFCASLWDTTDFFQSGSSGMLLLAMGIIRAGTLLIIFNINHSVNKFKNFYFGKVKDRILKEISKGYYPNGVKVSANRFERFDIRRTSQDDHPYEW
ncbi:hypothetical protein M501DRAFT_1029361 [Patellaria atrata CBS 101060]|uniref:Uncharacterized protein n=1 Tax=Patellaria atrata CBS 101060 TaxID=1346257 RepID=A0A9P4VTT1_9PEZI|nr:hypothetical protein M501DRAFT_1029361 [Patellaria atrata CBS 101060]